MDEEPWESRIRILGRITASERDFLLETLRGPESRCSRLQCVHTHGKWHLLAQCGQTLRERIRVEDLGYLIQKKALSLPCNHIRDEIFANFLRYVYPPTPLINIDEFYTRNLQDDDLLPANGSLILTQAILFAGSQFTALSTLQEIGFTSTREACEHFYRNVKLLQCLDVEADICSKISVCLLMSGSFGREGDARYWIDQAISLAFQSGLHRNKAEYQPDSSLNRLEKRLWWCCYIKDRLASFPRLERARIRDTEHDIPAMERQDFEEAIIHPRIRAVARDFVDEFNDLVQNPFNW